MKVLIIPSAMPVSREMQNTVGKTTTILCPLDDNSMLNVLYNQIKNDAVKISERGDLMKNKKYSDMTFVMDIDGTICPIKRREETYEDLVPYTDIVEKMRMYHNEGAKIILYTSRNMNSYNGNIGLINKNTARILLNWLERWEIPYDEIVYGKIWPGHKGFYVDDRTVRPNEFINCKPEELEEICKSSRIEE